MKHNHPAPASSGHWSSSGEQGSTWRALAQIYAHATRARRKQFYLVLALMLVGGIAELGTIGSIVPFLALIANPAKVAKFAWLGMLGIDRLFAAALLFAGFAVVAGVIRLELTRTTQKFAFGIGHDLIVEIERRLISQPYGFHVAQNSGKLLASLGKVEDLVFEALLPVMQALVGAFLALAIVVALLYLDPLIALIGGAAFVLVYVGVSVAARQRLARNSRIIADSLGERMKVAQESLSGIRDVIIDGTQEKYLALFERVNSRLSVARANTAFIAVAPRFGIETVGIVMIAAVAVFIVERGGGLATALPALGAIALGAQRLLPLLQQIYGAISTARGQRAVLFEITALLHLPEPDRSADDGLALPFSDRITLRNVSFAYPNRRNSAVEDVSFELPRGSSLAIVGETGSGKSTLADLLMGLLDGYRGTIAIDGVALTTRNRRRWQRNIGHIPQSIFLADASIGRNVALGVADERPDWNRVRDACAKAQLHGFVESLPQAYETLVGDHGIRLSGGQRQRLALARVIYKQAPVLVLDEPTSALDYDTEAAVIETLEQLRREGRTVIIIAHRRSTIRHCDVVARLGHGRMVEFGPLTAAARKQQRSS